MWVVIPVKDLNSSKSRLAHALPDHARPALMGALLADLLDMLKPCREVSGIAVVTRCPTAGQLASSHGAEVMCLDADRCLNSGASAAIRTLENRGIRQAMILHADLPLADTRDIRHVISAHTAAAVNVTLVPDNHGNGTNALLLDLPSAMQFFYGENSCPKHIDYCRRHGLAVQQLKNEHLGCDIDLWQDFAPLLSLRAAGSRPQLARWLEQYGELFDWPLAANL